MAIKLTYTTENSINFVKTIPYSLNLPNDAITADYYHQNILSPKIYIVKKKKVGKKEKPDPKRDKFVFFFWEN